MLQPAPADSFSAGPVSSRLSLQKGTGHLLAPPCTRHSPNVTWTGTKKNPVLYCPHSLSTSSLNGFRSVSEPLGLWRTSTILKFFLRAGQLDSTGCLSVPRHVPASCCRVRVEKSPYTVRTVVCDQDGKVGIRHANSKRRAVEKPSHAVLANFDHLLRHRFSSSQWVSPGSMLSTTVYACWTKALPFQCWHLKVESKWPDNFCSLRWAPPCKAWEGVTLMSPEKPPISHKGKRTGPTIPTCTRDPLRVSRVFLNLSA